MTQVTSEAFVLAMSALGGGIVMLAIIGVGIGIGFATGKAAEAVGKQPEAEGPIFKTMIIGAGLAEALGIFSFIISIMLIVVNPLIGKL